MTVSTIARAPDEKLAGLTQSHTVMYNNTQRTLLSDVDSQREQAGIHQFTPVRYVLNRVVWFNFILIYIYILKLTQIVYILTKCFYFILS